MRQIYLTLLFLCIAGSALSVTNKELLDALNLARQNPKAFADLVKQNPLYWNATSSTWVATTEVNCYQKAYDWLMINATAGAPLLQADAAVVAAYNYSRLMASVGYPCLALQGTTTLGRVQEVADFVGSSYVVQNVGGFRGITEARSWIFNWIADCGSTTRVKRSKVYSRYVSFGVCSEAYNANIRASFATCVTTTPLTLKQSLVGSALYTSAMAA